MTERYPRLYADDRGVWEEDMSGDATGIEWDEIVAVSGSKEEGIPEVCDAHVRIELDEGNGHYMTLLSDLAGFPEVAEAVSRRLDGIAPEWLAQLEQLDPEDVPVTVWRRSRRAASPDVCPRLGADDHGVWCEKRPGHRFVVEWDKIDGVNGLRRFSPDGEVVCTGLELELVDQALPVDLDADWPGFSEVVEAMTGRLPGLAAGWFAQIPELPSEMPGAPPGGLLANPPVWRRAGPEGYPRVYADDEGAWQEDAPGKRFGLKWQQINSVGCGFCEGEHGETLVAVEMEGKNGALNLGQDPDALYSEPSPEMVATITARLGLPPAWFVKAKELKPTRAPLMLRVRSAPTPIRAVDRGVCLQDLAQGERVTEWDTIFSVLARRRHQHGRPEGAVSIVLDLAGLGRRSLHEEEPGFAEVMEALKARLPGMPTEWLAEIGRLQQGQATMVWRRACPDGYPRLYTDDRGVWRENMPGERFGQPWDGIWRVLGRKLEGTPGQIEVELAGTGPGLFFQPDCQGFSDVVEVIATRLPGMQAEWPGKIERLTPGHALWRKGWVIADEGVGPDGMLATTWERADDERARRPPSAQLEPPRPGSPPQITEELAKKVLEIVEKELSGPLYEPCGFVGSVEGPLCDALGVARGDAFGDGFGWVSPALRILTRDLVISDWTSGKARAEGLRRLALAQLGSHVLNDRTFARRVAEMTIRMVLPRGLRAAAADLKQADKKAALLAAAERCEREGSRDAANAAEVAANAVNERRFVSSAASSVAHAAWHAAMSDAAAAGDADYCAAGVTRDADQVAAYVVAHPAESAARDAVMAVRYTGRNAELTAFAESVLQILTEMGAPGCQWLHLGEQRKRD